ncbi:MAG: arginine--tRNA ligase [Campylobacterota bacterium]|nr:arginine--tRNA ligase [Campylobacterota bacterium]
MQTKIKKIIEGILERTIVLEKPKDRNLGHFSTPIAFSLAKELRKSPMIIAEDLAKQFDNVPTFTKVESVKGFLNFTLSDHFLNEEVSQVLHDEENFAKGEHDNNKKQKILLEYVSANPTGPLHIGHARGAILGDTLCRVGRYLGYDITSEYYINDAGSQMDLLGLSIYLAGREHILKVDVEYPQSYYRGEYLLPIAQLCVDQLGIHCLEDVTHLKEMALIGKDEVMKIIIKDLSDLGVQFDQFVSEKSLYDKWESTKEVLEQSKQLYTKEGKLWLASTQAGDDADRVVVRENGVPTYLAGDIIYHKDKFDRGYEKLINIWGADHHGYIPRVKAAVQFLGNDPKNLEVILSQMVALLKGGEPYKMSKRAGNVILMSDITEQIGSDALRFVFLTKKTDTHLEFDLDILKNQDSSNPIFYINYAHARVNQLFKKANKSLHDLIDTPLTTQNEDAQYLIYEALLLHDVLNEAFTKNDMQKITDYLHSLASLTHKFYNSYKIVGVEEEDQYLKILSLVAMSIRVGLKLLGITAKKEM